MIQQEFMKYKLGDLYTSELNALLLDSHYFDAPASAIDGRNKIGDLWKHSFNVSHQLDKMTSKMNLKWNRRESPWIIGLFHDIIKADDYCFKTYPTSLKADRLINHKYKYSYNPDDHGLNSYLLLKDYINLTKEEKYCIIYHQGAFTSKDRWQEYNDAIRKYPNVLFTHTADMVASQLIELGYSYN